MNIIGISAKKLGGKTTAIQGLLPPLQALGETVATVSFADALKNLFIDYWLFHDDEVVLPSDLDAEDLKNRLHPCGKTYRELLQTIGTDWFRSLWPDIWVANYRHHLSLLTPGTFILTPDVRFPNEVRAIQELGGHVLRLLRAPRAAQDTHPSETALDGFTGFDAILDNSAISIPEQHEAVWRLVMEKGWIPV